MSKLLLKISKIIPRLDSLVEAEQLAAVNAIRKLLLTNVDDEASPPIAQPLKFVDVGVALTDFVKAMNEVEVDEEIVNAIHPEATINPEPVFRPGHNGHTQSQPQSQFHSSASFHPAAARRKPNRPAGDGWRWNLH